MIKRVFFSYFLYNFGTKMANFVQFLANFSTKTYKNCTKNGIFLLYLQICVTLLRICVAILCIKRINVALIYNKWYAYLHKLPPHLCICVAIKIFDFVYNMVYTMLNIRFCIQYSAYYMCRIDFIMCSYDFIMCRIRDFALFLVKICRIIQ